MKNKIVIRLWQIDGSWTWRLFWDTNITELSCFYDYKSSAKRAAKRAVARLQACTNVEVVCHGYHHVVQTERKTE